MILYDALTEFAFRVRGPTALLLALAMSGLVFLVYRNRSDFNRHAIQNMAATIVVYGLNFGAFTFFFREINVLAQSAYFRLGIPTLPEDFWTGGWVVVGLILAILLKDFCDYGIHRVMHTRIGWPSHAAHHTDTHVNGLTTFRVHAIEPFLMALNYMVILTWLQLPDLLPVMALVLLLHNIYVHLNLDWTHGRFKYLLASPVFHRWHHADVPEAYGKNLANVFPFFDVLFGTYHEAGPCRAPMGALAAGLSDKNPFLIWIYPFQAWGGMLLQGAQRFGELLIRRIRPLTRQRPLPPAE